MSVTGLLLIAGLASNGVPATHCPGAPQDTNDRQVEKIHVHEKPGRVTVMSGNRPFVTYDYSTYRKPIFYPVLGPRQLPMTRNFPMQTIAGEADDHPHHKSMWVGHQINGVDFWSERDGRVRLRTLSIDPPGNGFRARHDWIEDRTGEVIVCDEVDVRFAARRQCRLIDYQITFVASVHDATFADTKEGFFALRLNPSLRLQNDPARGVTRVSGSAVNDRGDSGLDVWGKPARWVGYHGQINGIDCGVAIFDHPSNLRHPTTWHARGYGLFAANPFGLHHFRGQPSGEGAFVLNRGDRQTFRYRVVLHLGSTEEAEIARLYDEYKQQ